MALERLRDGVDQRIEVGDLVALESHRFQPASAVETAGEADESVRVGRDRFVDRRVVPLDGQAREPLGQLRDGGVDGDVARLELLAIVAGRVQRGPGLPLADAVERLESLEGGVFLEFEQLVDERHEVIVGPSAPAALDPERAPFRRGLPS